MRERSQTTPRRRKGPKQPLPRTMVDDVDNDYDLAAMQGAESPYYTIDNTEDIYGTTLLPSQRCYVDPWDLENYDYVRKKIGDAPAITTTTTATAAAANVNDYDYEPQEINDESSYGYARYEAQQGVALAPRMSATMPRPHTRQPHARAQCQLACCASPQPMASTMTRTMTAQRRSRSRSRRHPQEDLYAARSELYGVAQHNRYDDYMAQMTRQLHLDEFDYMAQQQQIYNGYGGLSSASSTEQHHSSIGSEDPYNTAATLQRRKSQALYGYGYGTTPLPSRKKHSNNNSNKNMHATPISRVASPKPTPHIDFPAPPPLSPAYDYCNPYATAPYCSIPDCYECQQHGTSLIYAAPGSIYGGQTTTQTTLSRGQSASPVSGSDSSLYAGIYANKFALSKKGLLQIDYSCSWNDLDRVMGRHY